jgi:DNA ligase-1
LTKHFKRKRSPITVAIVKRNRTSCFEVAFNSIQPSTRHATGLALRFPRIKTVRRDKNVDSIDTLQYARNLAQEREFAGRF